MHPKNTIAPLASSWVGHTSAKEAVVPTRSKPRSAHLTALRCPANVLLDHFNQGSSSRSLPHNHALTSNMSTSPYSQ